MVLPPPLDSRRCDFFIVGFGRENGLARIGDLAGKSDKAREGQGSLAVAKGVVAMLAHAIWVG